MPECIEKEKLNDKEFTFWQRSAEATYAGIEIKSKSLGASLP
jgi:hypothetical protein